MSSRRGARSSLRSTRVKPAISYAESPSDSEDVESDNSDELAESSTARRTSSRRRTKSRVQPQRASQRIRAYQSEGSDEDESDLDLDELVALEPTRPSRRSTRSMPTRNGDRAANLATPRRKRSRHQLRTYHSDDPEDDRPRPKKLKLTKPPTSKSSSRSTAAVINNINYSGVVPAWQTLPYYVLLQIFRYAAYPLYDVRTFQSSPSATWLLKMARLCRQFTEPALTALYSSPPLVPMIQAHRLVDILRADPSTMAFGYRQKIESLHIDVGQVVAYSLTGSGHLDLYDLLKDLPRLIDLELYHQKDMAPYRNLDDTIKWTYPVSLFDALERIERTSDPMRGDKSSICKLRSWRWSSRLAGKQWSIDHIQQVHIRPSFSTLRKIAFVNYQVPVTKKDEEAPNHQKILADSLKPLEHLEHLIFESSTLVDKKLLPLLPKNLRYLELINCWEITADDFAEFLLTHGSQFRGLTLNHNQSLSLEFLPVLGTACPHLQVFKMNLHYFNLHATYQDSEPIYKHLLLPEQVPVWPSTLQTIELTQLRKWEAKAAETLLQSLLNSASTLPDLRKLTLQCILNIGWRERATFRDEWIPNLERVFKRVSPPPQKYVSLRAKSEAEPEFSVLVTSARHGPLPTIDTDTASSSFQSSSATQSPARRSQRTTAKPGVYAESDDSEAETEIRVPIEPARRPKLNALERELNILRQTGGIDSLRSSPITSSDGDVPLSGKGKGKTREYIQGMCEVVEVRIDNLRPTENQVTEADFLDEEASGDEDWNGDDDNVATGGGYAW